MHRSSMIALALGVAAPLAFLPGCRPAPRVPTSPTPLPDPLVRTGQWIAFQSDRDGNGEIYVIKIAGTVDAEVMNLTRNPAEDAYPTWSADGNRIAFISDRVGALELYVLTVAEAATGGAPVRVTHDAAEDWAPAWSADGLWIAFGSNRPPAHEDVYAVSEDGLQQVRLTDSPAVDSGPTWSPDGTRLAFYSDRDGDGEIYVIPVADALQGAGVPAPVNLTQSPAQDVFPSWSPDGTRIAFTSDRDGNFEIYVVNADGSGLVRLTHDDGIDTTPQWSPDGGRIAFSSTRDDNTEIYIMNPDGSGQTNVTRHPAEEYTPAWRP